MTAGPTVHDGPPADAFVPTEAFAPIAFTVRSERAESVHHGAAIAVDATGAPRAGLGDPGVGVYLRSALKPLQATAMVELGLDLPDDLLALVAASHSGEPAHVAGVKRILERHGFTPDDLGNTPSLPYGTDARAVVLQRGDGASPILQNCSGKHAGMLATCRINGWPTDDYLDPDHPLQEAITASLTRLGARVGHIGVDGCGAPTHLVSLIDAARALGRLVCGPSPVPAAMSAHPEMVGGTGRDVTEWMAAVPGLVAKEGAEGVMVLAMPDGSAAALKIADGQDRARQAATVEALRWLGVDVDGELSTVRDRVTVPVLGHGLRVGEVRPLEWPAWTS